MKLHFAGERCSSVQRCHYIADRQAQRPCQASSSRTSMAAPGRDVAEHWPPLARRGCGSEGGDLGRQLGGGPRRRGGGATALRCAARAPAIPRRVGSRQHLKEALEQAWRRRGNVDDGHQRKHAACTRRCDLRRRRPASGARAGHPGVDGKWNTVPPGWYFIYRLASMPPGPSDPLCAARISQYQVKADRHTRLPWPHLLDSDERRSPRISSSSASSRTATRAYSHAEFFLF